MGLPPERAGSAIRFSLGKDTTAAEIDGTLETLERIRQRQNRRFAGDSVQHALV
jgi:cysteine sulfinate desulfinase/cysteine desulfurase-like protein